MLKIYYKYLLTTNNHHYLFVYIMFSSYLIIAIQLPALGEKLGVKLYHCNCIFLGNLFLLYKNNKNKISYIPSSTAKLKLHKVTRDKNRSGYPSKNYEYYELQVREQRACIYSFETHTTILLS